MQVAYISGPYRAKEGRTVFQNVRAAEQVALRYWKAGYAVICPHMNTAFFDGECDDNVWLQGDLEIVPRCDVIVMMPHWAESSGARLEHDEAMRAGLDVIYEEGQYAANS